MHVARHQGHSERDAADRRLNPMVQYIVDEIVAAGIKEIVLVTHSSKNAVENHFDTSYRTGSAAGAARQNASCWQRFRLSAPWRNDYERASGQQLGFRSLHSLRASP